jgi:glutathione S-transferase
MLPILYSLQHCPYAMRARLGLLVARQQVMLRAVTTKNKPAEMLTLSPKGTIPVLILPDSTVIDESLDIMLWALQENDPQDLLHKDQPDNLATMLELIRRNDQDFKPQLESYKKAKRFHLENEIEERQKCEVFIDELEQCLASNQSADGSKTETGGSYFIGQKPSLIDYALLPFVRQFSRVHRAWFVSAPYPNLRAWLDGHLQSRLYAKAMAKYPLWLDNYEETVFGEV